MAVETNRKTTIYDIARLSAASPSTVSAVLNGSWEKRRIARKTVDTVRRIASEQGYTLNRQARGLRQAKSGLVGMIIPIHDNRFFSSLSQSFDTLARERGLCPVIASTLRRPEEERRIVETLISYAVDSIVIAGATDPDSLSAVCTAAGVPHVFVDLPCRTAPSVVTNNYRGAQQLTRQLIVNMPAVAEPARGKAYFLGGSARDHASGRRFAAFRDVVLERVGRFDDDQLIECGYAPRSATTAIEALSQRIGGLPAALFVNSLTAFEGVMSYFVRLPPQAFQSSVIGCFDYDPFAAFLQFPVYMVRQNSAQLIHQAYELLGKQSREPVLIEVEPDLIEPRTMHKAPPSEVG